MRILLAMIVLGMCLHGAVASAETYDQLISDLAKDSKTAKDAERKLRRAGVDAFPALLHRLKDFTEVANDCFAFRSRMVKMPDGRYTPSKPTIGDLSFDLIQDQIEGFSPPKHLSLNPKNVKAWLSSHKKDTLEKLRLIAAMEAVESVANEIAETGLTDYLKADLFEVVGRLKECEKAIQVRP